MEKDAPDTLPQKMCRVKPVFSLLCLKGLFSLAPVILPGKSNTYASLHMDCQCSLWYTCRIPNDSNLILGIPMRFNNEKPVKQQRT